MSYGNVAITAGAGTNISVDTVAGVNVQRVKLMDGTADGTAPIASGSGAQANALRVIDAQRTYISGTNNIVGTGITNIIAAPGAATAIYVTTLCGYNSNTTDTWVNILDGANVRLVIPLAAKGGFTMALPVPLKCSNNVALNFQSGASVTTAFVSAVGYTEAS